MVTFTIAMKQRLFDWVWQNASDSGLVDERGGAEYRRQHEAWIKAGRPVDPIVIEIDGFTTDKDFELEGQQFFVRLIPRPKPV